MSILNNNKKDNLLLPIVITTVGLTAALLLTYYLTSKVKSIEISDHDYDVENYDLVTSRPIYKKPESTTN